MRPEVATSQPFFPGDVNLSDGVPQPALMWKGVRGTTVKWRGL